MNLLHTLKILLFNLISLLAINPALGQEKIDIAAGFGFPELVNIGVRFQLEQSQLGLYVGTFPGAEGKVLTMGGDYYYHFGGASNFSQRRPWYAKAGLSYYQDENEYFKTTSLFLVPRIGRDLNLSPRVGIALEAGVFFLIDYTEEEIKPQDCWICGGPFVNIGPSFGLTLFYRI